MIKSRKAFFSYIILTLLIYFLFDYLSKIIFNLELNNPIFYTVQTKNTGAAFGMLQNNSQILGILGFITIILIGLYVFLKVDFQNKFKIILASMFSSGIIGNSLQRFLNGYVEDFIKISFFDFPVFNFFDTLICLSVFCYFIICIKGEFNR